MDNKIAPYYKDCRGNDKKEKIALQYYINPQLAFYILPGQEYINCCDHQKKEYKKGSEKIIYMFEIVNKEDLKIGFTCPKCLDEGFEEDKIYIEPKELKNHYSYSTYRINSKENPEIWKAKSYFMIGDIEKALATLYPLIKDEIKDNKDKKSIVEKIAPYFTIGNAGTNIIDKLLPHIDKFLNFI